MHADRPGKVMFLMPTLPHYRNGFFESLQEELKGTHRILVVHGRSGPTGKAVRYEKTERLETAACPVHRINLLKFRITWIDNLVSVCRSYSPDVVIVLFSFGVISFWVVALLCKVRGIPLAIWGSGYRRPEIKGVRRLLKEKMASLALRCASAHLCYGSRYAEELAGKGIGLEKIFVAQEYR